MALIATSCCTRTIRCSLFLYRPTAKNTLRARLAARRPCTRCRRQCLQCVRNEWTVQEATIVTSALDAGWPVRSASLSRPAWSPPTIGSTTASPGSGSALGHAGPVSVAGVILSCRCHHPEYAAERTACVAGVRTHTLHLVHHNNGRCSAVLP